ncbi:hypothetical protein [Mycolicibacterium thermoresistibile]
MTTPEQHVQPTPAPQAGAPPHSAPAQPGAAPEPTGGQMHSPPQSAPPPGATDTARADSDESLFGDLLSGLRSRWDEVQAGFVDDPQQCVQQADRLVSDVVDRVTARFEEARTRLEAQWARGEQASTEDLRLALKRYRTFFQRLLAMDDSDANGTHSAPAPPQQPARTQTPTA